MRIGLVGGGTMGVGIAHRFAVHGASVTVVDVDLDTATSAAARIAGTLREAVARGKLAEEAADAAIAAVNPAAGIDELERGLDFIIEAVIEDPALKQSVLAASEEREPQVLASNTSSISIDRLATPLRRPELFAGMHFFNPVWAIHLVEVIKGTATSEATIGRVRDGVDYLGMEAAVINDAPGFATSRLGVLLGLEAVRMVEEGVAEPADIDRAMELGYGYPMGPLRTGDLVGLDVRLAIAEHLAGVYGERFEPPLLLRRMVEEGRLGKKTGGGFYDWD